VNALAGPSLAELVQSALREDLGTGDVTSEATVPEHARARARIVQKAGGVIYGLEAALLAFRLMDPGLCIEQRGPEGEWREPGAVVLVATGNARALLGAERTALNFLGRLSGIATATALGVRELAGTTTRLLDTRKTTPGLRALEKEAVVAGGGTNHRAGLYDAILLKENHIATAGGIAAAVAAAGGGGPPRGGGGGGGGGGGMAEARAVAEIDEAIAAGAERLLLDNMSVDELRSAVSRVAGRAQLEASGRITLETLRAVAATGVDFVSMGSLTHSAAALDLSLGLELLA